MTSAIRSGALPVMAEWSTMFGDATGRGRENLPSRQNVARRGRRDEGLRERIPGSSRRHAGRCRVARRRARAGDPDDQEHADRADGAEPRDEAQPHRARRDGARRRCARDLQVAQGDPGVPGRRLEQAQGCRDRGQGVACSRSWDGSADRPTRWRGCPTSSPATR